MDQAVASKIEKDLARIRDERADVVEKQAKLEKDRTRLEEEETALARVLKFYRGDTGTGTPNDQPAANQESAKFSSLTIANAAAHILKSRSNTWMTIRDIEQAFREHGKTTRYNAIDGTLRESDRFERRKVGKQNQFRLRAI